MIDLATHQKILALQEQIAALHKAALRRASGRDCYICGGGDMVCKHAVLRVAVAIGYEHRQSAAPWLCYKHMCSWRLSLSHKNAGHKPDVETDLYFAEFLAKQLVKQSRNTERNEHA